MQGRGIICTLRAGNAKAGGKLDMISYRTVILKHAVRPLNASRRKRNLQKPERQGWTTTRQEHTTVRGPETVKGSKAPHSLCVQ